MLIADCHLWICTTLTPDGLGSDCQALEYLNFTLCCNPLASLWMVLLSFSPCNFVADKILDCLLLKALWRWPISLFTPKSWDLTALGGRKPFENIMEKKSSISFLTPTMFLHFQKQKPLCEPDIIIMSLSANRFGWNASKFWPFGKELTHYQMKNF